MWALDWGTAGGGVGGRLWASTGARRRGSLNWGQGYQKSMVADKEDKGSGAVPRSARRRRSRSKSFNASVCSSWLPGRLGSPWFSKLCTPSPIHGGTGFRVLTLPQYSYCPLSTPPQVASPVSSSPPDKAPAVLHCRLLIIHPHPSPAPSLLSSIHPLPPHHTSPTVRHRQEPSPLLAL